MGRERCVGQVWFRWHALGLRNTAASGLLPQVTEQQLRRRQEKSHMHLETTEYYFYDPSLLLPWELGT